MILRALLTLSLLIIASALHAEAIEQVYAGQPLDGIVLDGTNLIKAPETNFVRPGANWTYPYSYYPIYAEGQPISGTYSGPDRLAGSRVGIYVSNFSVSEFLNSSFTLANIRSGESYVSLNSTGDARFNVTGISSGTYTLYVVDRLNSTVLSALPLIVTAQDASIDSQTKVIAGGALKVTVKMPQQPREFKRYYGAVMVSRKDYGGIRLDILSNADQSLSSTIALGNRSTQIQGLPSLSTNLLMKMFSMLPQNSAVAMQESTKPEAEFYLITDPEWERGNYILTCVIYSSGKGILGLCQKAVEVI